MPLRLGQEIQKSSRDWKVAADRADLYLFRLGFQQGPALRPWLLFSSEEGEAFFLFRMSRQAAGGSGHLVDHIGDGRAAKRDRSSLVVDAAGRGIIVGEPLLGNDECWGR